MKRFILSSEADRNGKIKLSGGDYHYLARVRRLAPGEYFQALLPSNKKVLIRIDSVEGGVLSGTVELEKDPLPDMEASAPVFALPEMPRLILFQGIPKGDKMDLIVRQAAEGGLAEIVPFAAEYSVLKLPKRGAASGKNSGTGIESPKISRWRRIIKEARQQSGSGALTAVNEPVTVDGVFAYWEKLKGRYSQALGLFFHQLPLEQGSLHGYLDKRPEIIAAAIGPEGGFSPAEVSRFLGAGFKPVTIGNSVLRTETAAVYAAAAIRIILLERESWEMSRQ